MSKEHALNYDFPTQSTLNTTRQGLTCGDKFVIEPAQGTLQPGKFIELKITLTTNSYLSCYEGEVPCHITWASNKYATEDNDLTQNDVMMSAKKESLFLRIKKRSELDVPMHLFRAKLSSLLPSHATLKSHYSTKSSKTSSLTP